MKNIHLLPTDKPSRLVKNSENILKLCIQTLPIDYEIYCYPQHIYITSDEEIKEGDWCLTLDETFKPVNLWFYPEKLKGKIILTTDQDLIKDGVQAIDDEFLEWFVKNPSCEEVEIESEIKWKSTVYDQPDIEDGIIYKPIIPQEEPKQIKCYCGHTITCDCGPLEETLEEHNYLQGFINQFEEEGEYQELSNDDWTVSEFLKWMKLNKFKIIKDEKQRNN